MTEADVSKMIEEYRTKVQSLFDDCSSEIVGNASPRHAAILIEEMVVHAEQSFKAFAGKMNPDVWNERVMEALRRAVEERHIDIKLVVECDCEPIKRGTMPESVRKFVRKLDPETRDKLRDKLSHCASGDGKSLRIETDADQKSAVFSANRPETASQVAAVVEGLYTLSVECGNAA